VLEDLMIKTGYQSRGIGTQAVRQIEEHLKNRGFEILLLESGLHNEGAHNSFEKNGFSKLSIEYARRLK
jgi:ribosomal protein S18 acetylase RimI-like enzyme